MSDSLRDQLLKAGFKQTEKKKRTPKRATAGSSPARKSRHPQTVKTNTDTAAATLAKKKLKAEIAQLLNAKKVAKPAGDVGFHFQLGSRIRQLFVNEATHKKLCTGELVLTRLNGDTLIIPTDVADQVLLLNPNWLIVRPTQSSADTSNDETNKVNDNEAYKDFPVPDDITW